MAIVIGVRLRVMPSAWQARQAFMPQDLGTFVCFAVGKIRKKKEAKKPLVTPWPTLPSYTAYGFV